jgi:hypothetical protein
MDTSRSTVLADCIADRMESAVCRFVESSTRYRHSRDTFRWSVWHFQTSRLVRNFPHLRPMCGASDETNGDGVLSTDDICSRIRPLLAIKAQRGTPVKFFAGASANGRRCAMCDATIEKGQMEFEVALAGEVIVFLDRRCADLWTREASALP